jgi:ATP-dependent DNA helicase RecG
MDAELHEILISKEDEHLECKRAESSYEFTELLKYCCALANEGGGRMVLGVTPTLPRTIIGTRAFEGLERTKVGLLEQLHIRIDAREVMEKNKRVVIFYVPSRPMGTPIEVRGSYWMRSGESLVPMTSDRLKTIFAECGPDFSALSCPGAKIEDLDPKAIEIFRSLWARKSSGERINQLSIPQLLEDSEMIFDGAITYAALVLAGTRKALSRHLPQSEIIFEYRGTESLVKYQQRKEYREGFLLSFEDIWATINTRNEVQHFQDGLLIWDIPTFKDTVIREAVLNAVGHRDYRLAGSIFIKQYPRTLSITSPGGLPAGITPENILDRQAPRNRRIVELFSKCGFVERSGQGLDIIWENCIRDNKSLPDFTGSDAYQVLLTISGVVRDTRFIKFIEEATKEQRYSFTLNDLIIINQIYSGKKVTDIARADRLKEHGIIEKVSRKRGLYILSKRFYAYLDQKGTYTRKKGLDRETNKALLLKHINDNQREGSRLLDLYQVLPTHNRSQLQVLLRELKDEGKVFVKGKTRNSRWFPRGT